MKITLIRRVELKDWGPIGRLLVIPLEEIQIYDEFKRGDTVEVEITIRKKE